MKIQKIRIKGFKNIEDTVIDFSKITALIALNNYGKSNLIQSIDFAKTFIQATEKERQKMMGNPNLIPINSILANAPFEFEITIRLPYQEDKYTVRYLFSFEWIKNTEEKGQQIIKEVLQYKKIQKGSKFTNLIKRTSGETFYLSSSKGRCDTPLKVSKNELAINKLSNFDNLFYLELISMLLNIEMCIYQSVDLDDLFETVAIHVNSSKDESILEFPTKEDITESIWKLKENHNQKYELLVDSIISLLPDIEFFDPISIDLKEKYGQNFEDIPFKVPETLYDIRIKIKTNNQPTSISYLSSGAKKIVFILTAIIAADIKKVPVFAFEELENSIHPYLLQKLLITLDALTENTKILISSHSPYLIKYLDLEYIYLGIPNDKGTAFFKQIKKTKRKRLIKYAEASNNSLGDVVFDMLAEGILDSNVFEDYI